MPCCALVLLLSIPVRSQTAENVMVIVNANSPDSIGIGKYYAAKRGLPASHVCSIRTTEDPSVPQDVFLAQVLEPVVECLKSGQLQDRILYLVTTKGVPLMVEGDGGPAGEMASVDSELSLAYTHMVYGSYNRFGRAENPYFVPDYRSGDFHPFTRARHDIYLVTRLTGATLVDAVLLVDRALSPRAEGSFYFDLPSQQQSVEREWFSRAATELKSSGVAVTLETTAVELNDLTGVRGYACLRDDGSDNPSSPVRIEWLEGALALSFRKSTGSPRPVPGGQRHLDAETGSVPTALSFVSQGVSGVGAFVADHTLDDQFRPQVLFPAYAAGHNLAESFYMSQRYLSWRHIVIGDPLASPYSEKAAARRQELAVEMAPRIHPDTGLPFYFSERRKNSLVQRYSTSEDAVVAHLRAEGLVERGDLERARASLEESLVKDPYLVESHLLMARVAEETGDLERALQHYEQVAQQSQPNREIYLRLCRLALGLGFPERAEPFARRLYGSFGHRDVSIRKLWADLQLLLNRTEEAKAIYHGLVQGSAGSPYFALAALGHIHFQEGSTELARDFLGQALEQAEGRVREWGYRSSHEDPEYLRALLEQLEAEHPAAADGGEARDQDQDIPASTEPLATPARVLSRVAPRYPLRAMRSRIEGRVVLNLLIDEMGQLLKVTPVSGHRELVGAAEDAVRQWRFAPKMTRGRAQPSLLTVSVEFQIRRNRGTRTEDGPGLSIQPPKSPGGSRARPPDLLGSVTTLGPMIRPGSSFFRV